MWARCLAKAIIQNKSLRRVDLHNNLIGDDGAVALAEGIMCRQYPRSSTTTTCVIIDPNLVQ